MNNFDPLETAVEIWQTSYANNGGNLQGSMIRSINTYLECIDIEKVAKQLFLSQYTIGDWKSLHKTQKDHWLNFANIAIQSIKM